MGFVPPAPTIFCARSCARVRVRLVFDATITTGADVPRGFFEFAREAAMRNTKIMITVSVSKSSD